MNYDASNLLPLKDAFVSVEEIQHPFDSEETEQQQTLGRGIRMYERLLEASAVLQTSLELGEILRRILLIVQETGFDRARLYLLSTDRQSLIGVAQVGTAENSFTGINWRVADDDFFHKLVREPRPHIFQRDAGRPEHSEAHLDKEGIAEWACVPLLLRGEVIGHLSADNKYSRRPIFESELAPLALFSAHAAAAIEKAQLMQETAQWASQLDALRRTTLTITSSPTFERGKLLSTVIAQAVELLNAKSGGVYEYLPELGELVLVADHNRLERVGNRLKVGEGAAGKLVLSGAAFQVTDDYNSVHDYNNLPSFGAVLEVPLRWQERIIGVLYVDDEVGRKFSHEDARLLGLFADQAAIVIVNQELAARDEEKLKRLEKLSRASTEIMSSLGKLKSQELLTLIAKHATK